MHVIVDGYNVMHALPADRDWPGRTFRDRREGFVTRLSAYAAGRPHRVTVVFDGAKGGGESGGADRRDGVDVLYSARGEEADDVIRRLLDREPRPTDTLLVTSDRSLADYARARGASVARAGELVRRLAPRSAGASPSFAAAFEVHVKGYRLEPARRSPPRSKSRLALW